MSVTYQSTADVLNFTRGGASRSEAGQSVVRRRAAGQLSGGVLACRIYLPSPEKNRGCQCGF